MLLMIIREAQTHRPVRDCPVKRCEIGAAVATGLEAVGLFSRGVVDP